MFDRDIFITGTGPDPEDATDVDEALSVSTFGEIVLCCSSDCDAHLFVEVDIVLNGREPRGFCCTVGYVGKPSKDMLKSHGV